MKCYPTPSLVRVLTVILIYFKEIEVKHRVAKHIYKPGETDEYVVVNLYSRGQTETLCH